MRICEGLGFLGTEFNEMCNAKTAGGDFRGRQPDHGEEPCIMLYPAGVYKNIPGVLGSANPSNCLRCKTCPRKSPFDNMRWSRWGRSAEI